MHIETFLAKTFSWRIVDLQEIKLPLSKEKKHYFLIPTITFLLAKVFFSFWEKSFFSTKINYLQTCYFKEAHVCLNITNIYKICNIEVTSKGFQFIYKQKFQKGGLPNQKSLFQTPKGLSMTMSLPLQK